MVEVSNAGRVVFPEVSRTKGDVVAYYEKIAPRLLPYVLERPLSIKRYPKGLAGAGFFQKNIPKHYPPSFGHFEVPRNHKKNERETTEYPVVTEAENLPYLANQGAIELHVPTGTVADLMHPDRMVLDLDPPPKAEDLVKQAAQLVRAELEKYGVSSIPVATGSKGYHVTTKLSNTSGHFYETMHMLATLLAHAHPDVLTITYRVAQRGRRVFVDWLRNTPLATLVAPYSLRARPKATVATPLAWEELDATAPDAFSIADVDRLLDRPDTLAAAPVQDATPFEAKVRSAFEASGLVLEAFDRFRS